MAGFFDKVKDGLSKGVATAGAHSKAMLEKSKINAVISSLEKERTQIEQMLGQKIYEMFMAHGTFIADESIYNFISEIDKRFEAVKHQHEQLKRIEEEVRMVTGGGGQSISFGGVSCSACGCNNVPEALFCAGCGGKMADTQTTN